MALRNINFILQKQPYIFENNIKVFYTKFNDPVYVKQEKVDILVKVADEKNCGQIINELKQYASDVDAELVTASIKAIGFIVRKVESAAQNAADAISLIVKEAIGGLALQDSVVVARDILRKFPGKYEKLLVDDVLKKASEFYEVEAKASLLWIAGEYADQKTKVCKKIIQQYAEDFLQEPDPVKLQVLTASVKLYLKKPEDSEDLIQGLLKKATEEVDNPDLRDRAYIYWRMLSTSPEKTAEVVLKNKHSIEPLKMDTHKDVVIEELLLQISSICSIYHKTPEEMCKLYGISVSQGMVARAS